MANIGWGHGRPAESGTGIVQVLLAYGNQGGQLFGARRWPDNPLTLTHVRWQGQGGTTLDAERDPAHEALLSNDERSIWIELALAFPPTASGGSESGWLPLAVDQSQALAWAQRLRHSQASHHSLSGQQAPAAPYYSTIGQSSSPRMPAVESPARASFRPSGGSFVPPESSFNTPPPPFGGYGAPSFPPASHPASPSPWSEVAPGVSQGTGSWQRESAQAPEVVVLPCVEVELPALIEGQAGAAYRADFARDVAVHFGRAARSLPQVREMRGWMRGDRLILAARAVVGVGNRAPTRAENDGVAQALAQALSQRTLPYARLGFADPSEWMHGAALPE